MRNFTKVETVTCNNCSSKKSHTFLNNIDAVDNNETFNTVKCSNCGLVYLSPRPQKKYIGKYYSSENYWDKKASPKKAYKYLLNIINSRVSKGRILDVGAATGLFLRNYKNKDWEIEGTDVSKIATDYAKKKYGIKIKLGDFLDIKYPDGYFDIVTFNNVLEHVYKPKETLIKVHKVLKDGGMTLITVPNLNSIGLTLFKQNWYALDVPRHLYHFDPKVLKKMLIDSGFNNIKIRHGYFYHNFPVLFESFRKKFSPRIQMKKDTNYFAKSTALKKNLIYQMFKNVVVIFSKAIFIVIAYIEPVIKKGEVIVLEATK